MFDPASRAILWQLWRRHRWALIGGWAYLLMAAVACRWLPSVGYMRIEETQMPAVAYILGLSSFWVLVHLIAMFSLSSTKATESGFPRRMLTLPVSTRTLVAVPMITGCFMLGVTWLFIAGAVLRPG